MRKEDQIFVVHERRDAPENDNRVTLLEPDIGPGFAAEHFRE